MSSNEAVWIFLSLMAMPVAANAALGAISAILTKASAYWVRQPGRVLAGLDVEPEPWYVKLTEWSHKSRLLQRILK